MKVYTLTLDAEGCKMLQGVHLSLEAAQANASGLDSDWTEFFFLNFEQRGWMASAKGCDGSVLHSWYEIQEWEIEK